MAAPKLPDIQQRLEHVLEIDPAVARAANSAYSATIGAYESHVLKSIFDPNSLFLRDLAQAFALSQVPLKGIKKMDVDEDFGDDIVGDSIDMLTVASRNKPAGVDAKQEYVKGRFRSLHVRRMGAVAKYHREKTKQQWSATGDFIGTAKPNKRV